DRRRRLAPEALEVREGARIAPDGLVGAPAIVEEDRIVALGVRAIVGGERVLVALVVEGEVPCALPVLLALRGRKRGRLRGERRPGPQDERGEEGRARRDSVHPLLHLIYEAPARQSVLRSSAGNGGIPVTSHSDRSMIRRREGGLSCLPEIVRTR